MKPRVLVVEDNDLNLELLVQLLEDDYEVITRSDGRSGLTAISDASPAVVLLDMSLPEMDGWEVARQVRDNDAISATPIIALTAHAMPGDEERALEAGCDAYLTKPVDESDLRATLRRFVS